MCVIVIITINLSRRVVSYDEKLTGISKYVNSMSLENKIGQMLIIGIHNTYLDTDTEKMIQQYGIGGFNLLKSNIENREQTTKLISDIKKVSRIPPIIAVDQEGGEINRINFLEEKTSQINIGDISEAKDVAYSRAIELSELGVNMNFSPVLDYVSDKKTYLYSRTFGRSPEEITTLGDSMIQGYIAGGIIPVMKHFPGYGNIVYDPHHKTVESVNDGTLEKQLTPFRELSLKHPVPIMTAHITVGWVDSKPATISRKFLSEILRDGIGFDGVIITDDLEMGSVGLSPSVAAVEAIKAGADIVIITKSTESQIEAYQGLFEAVKSGEILESRIDQSVERILSLKKRFGLYH